MNHTQDGKQNTPKTKNTNRQWTISHTRERFPIQLDKTNGETNAGGTVMCYHPVRSDLPQPIVPRLLLSSTNTSLAPSSILMVVKEVSASDD